MATLNRCKPLLGTYVEISVSANRSMDTLLAASDIAFTCIQKIQDMMSFHDKNSELSQINRGALKSAVRVSTQTHNVLKFALELSALSDGVYDISVANRLIKQRRLPKHNYTAKTTNWAAIILNDKLVQFNENITIDLGGLAKGYAVDQAFESLLQSPITFSQIIINAGGDIRMLNWQDESILLKYPARWNRIKTIDYKMKNTALATSIPGCGSKSSFVIDPRIQKPIKQRKSVSIFAPSCMVADALTKLIYLSPKRTDILAHYSACSVSLGKHGDKQEFIEK